MSYKSQHTVILGSGLAGLFAAEKLAEAGFAVTVVHGEPGLGEASPLAQGVICSKGLTAADSELFAAKLSGQEVLRARLQSASEIPRIEGIVEPFFDEEMCNRILKRVYRKRPYTESGTTIERNATASTGVFNDTKACGWLRYPRDFWFDVDAFTKRLRADLVSLGVRFKSIAVKGWEERVNGWNIVGDREFLSCDNLVIAAGAGTDALLRASSFPVVGLVPVHGVILRGVAATTLPSCAFVHGAKSVVCHGSQVQIGGTTAKEWHEGDLDAHAQALREELFPLIDPGILARMSWRALHGVRVRVKDRMPVVGPWRRSSDGKPIYVLTGLYKNGLQVGEACAQHLACVMMGEDTPLQTRLFDSRRLV